MSDHIKVVVRHGNKIIKVVKCVSYDDALDMLDKLEYRYQGRGYEVDIC